MEMLNLKSCIVKELLKILFKRVAWMNQAESKIQKVIEKKGDKFYVKWKSYGNSFNRLIRKIEITKNKVEIDLLNYATKADLK